MIGVVWMLELFVVDTILRFLLLMKSHQPLEIENIHESAPNSSTSWDSSQDSLSCRSASVRKFTRSSQICIQNSAAAKIRKLTVTKDPNSFSPASSRMLSFPSMASLKKFKQTDSLLLSSTINVTITLPSHSHGIQVHK
jgi:hypothetical protein